MSDWVTLSKLGPRLVAPENIVFWAIVLAFVFALFRYRKAGLICLGIGLVTICVASSPIIGWFNDKIEFAYPPIAIESSPSAQAIVLLSGDISVPSAPRVESQIRGNRALHVSRLYKAGKAPIIIITGGNVFPQKDVESEAYYTKEILIELGIPENAILVEGKSRNTHENALETLKILDRLDIDEILLATSSFHMPRALAVFKKTGITVIPSTTSIGAVEEKPRILVLVDKFPALGDLGRMQRVMREYLGIVVYCFRGWLDCHLLYEELL